MLQLISGIPGYGKTAHAIDCAFFADATFLPLNKYVEGISRLDADKCSHFVFPKLSELKAPDFVPLSSVDDDDDEADKYKCWLPSHPDYAQHKINLIEAKHPIELWYLWAQKGSVLLIDEAQRFYRPRPSGSKVPLHVSMLEYHRHFGIHFIFISQAPRLVDVNLRSLVEKHVHLDKGWTGGMKYEWSGVRSIDDGKVSPSDKKDAAKFKYSPPKHVFPLYSSSSQHLKVKHKMPLTVWLFLAGIPLAIVLFVYAGLQFKKNHVDASGVSSSSSVLNVSPSPLGELSSSISRNASGVPQVLVEELAKFVPVVPAHPETAPAYLPLRKISSMPLVSACLASASKCSCYTQQGSLVSDIDDAMCREYLAGGHRFNPYALPVVEVARPPASAFSSPQGASLPVAMQQPQNLQVMPSMPVLDAPVDVPLSNPLPINRVVTAPTLDRFATTR